MPAGKTAADVVKQENLPPLVRVVRPSDGITLSDPNPNRQTLVLNEDGQIVDAVWGLSEGTRQVRASRPRPRD